MNIRTNIIKRMNIKRGFLFLFLCILFMTVPFLKKVQMVSVSAANSLQPPKGILANGVGSKVVVSWEPAKGADGYELYEKSSEKSGYIKVKKTKNCSIVLSDRKRGMVYQYRVRAYKKSLLKLQYGTWSRVAITRVAPKGSKTTLKNFLNTALAPVGSTMYIWDGGWKSIWKKKGADSAWIGLNPTWRSYAAGRKSSFDYRKVRYKTGYGLDCSGYVGWVTYNVMQTKSAASGRGYVNKSTELASRFSKNGWGSYLKAARVRNYRAGDVMSTTGHVYIVIGQCKDGSVVLVHSSPPGVQICGTATRTGIKKSQAVKLAEKYRKKYFPGWQKRFPVYYRPSTYIREYNQFRWYLSANHVMSDPDGYRNMEPEQILNDLLKNR